MSDFLVSRRQFLGMSFSAACTAFLPSTALGLVLPQKLFTGERKLHLYNTHTGESFNQPYWVEGSYLSENLEKIDFFLRDYRNNEIKPIQLELVELLYKLQHKMQYTKPFDVISGYRSVSTNRALRRKSRKVAVHSLHMEGAAIDLRFKDIPLQYAHKAVCALKAGGVGYYPGRHNRFIHMDVRKRVVNWVG